MDGLSEMAYAQTCSTGSVDTVVYFGPHQHCWALVRVTGNQHQRTEHRACSCGAKAKKVVRWNERVIRWEAA